ncbi:hypothetical protein JWG44_21785 [Leptospira sp. 201903071]|uniref:hypothetical protein n=1 Tax=Leptospira ainazelensis TaxID=2810034 RepID=UPI0019658929|nr:hypothetical protein [Leptospira ainazelensis]MBM9502887.1 hypothetical protein [Leptospira ainazelensis]
MNYPKYRSFLWWIYALFSYVSSNFWIYIGNKFIKRKNKEFIAKQYEYSYENQDFIFKKLIKKYKEFYWIEKYLEHGYAPMASEFGMVSFHFSTGCISYWSYEFTIEDCKRIIRFGIPFRTSIRLRNGSGHSIVIFDYNDKLNLFYAHDSLGDYFSNYKIWYGANVEFKFEAFLDLVIGNPISVYLFFPNKTAYHQFIKEFNNKFYSYP